MALELIEAAEKDPTAGFLIDLPIEDARRLVAAHAKLSSFERAIERRLIQLCYEKPPIMRFVGLDTNGLAKFERIATDERRAAA
jgi:hypothetical protein